MGGDMLVHLDFNINCQKLLIENDIPCSVELSSGSSLKASPEYCPKILKL